MGLIHPPTARRVPHQTVRHGETLVDDYFWLRDRSDPDVIAYLQAENAYAEQTMRHTETLQQQLYAELSGRIKETDLSVPEQQDAYFYYSRQEAGKQYPIFCRKQGSLDAAEEVLLDQNLIAAGHAFCRLGAYRVSPDHRLLAYSADTSGAECFTLFIKDLWTGELLADEIPRTYYGVEWAGDNRTIFYVVPDEVMRPYQLYRHTVGADPSTDVLVYHETDEAFYLSISKTRSKTFLLVVLESITTSEVWYLPADQPTASLSVVHPRQSGMEYSVDHHGDRFLIVTNDQARNFKLVVAPLSNPAKDYWSELIPHRPAIQIEGIDAFADYLAIYEREDGLKRLRICRPNGGDVRYVHFPEPVYTFFPGRNENFNTAVLRFTYSSPVTPDSVVDYDMVTGTWELKKQREIPSGYDPSQYRSERAVAAAPDGAPVPISLVSRASVVRDGRNPLLLYGYGAYGNNSEPTFSSSYLSLLDRGFVVAIAHVRGGSERGRDWYEQGKLLNKKNSFTDFIACAEHLIAERYTSDGRLAIAGASAGGLLVGAVVSLRPDLFTAVVARVPFVDVINTMSDPSLPLTVIEYEEWGNPNDRTFYDYVRSYSPYENVTAKAYPHMLVTAGLNDRRVGYWEPAKWTAKLRALKTDRNRLLLKTNLEAGHGGASGRYDRLKESAFEYAFLLDVVGDNA